MAAASLIRRVSPLVHVHSLFSLTCRTIASRQTEFMPWKKREFWRGLEPENQRSWHKRGMLPRLQEDGPPKGELHRLIHRPKDPWHPNDALRGQNDFVDILGDGTVHPVRLLSNVPRWLRGFKGSEMQMVNRMRRAFPEWKDTRPQKWLQMKKRLNHLYKHLNLDRRPPPFEEY